MNEKKLKCLNVGYLSNAHAKDVLDKMIDSGWGIDNIVTDENRDTWITFYIYCEHSRAIFNEETDKYECTKCGEQIDI